MYRMSVVLLCGLVFLISACSEKKEDIQVLEAQKKALDKAKGIEDMTLKHDQENRKKLDDMEQ